MIQSNEIKHGFGQKAHDLVGLFEDTNKMSSFMYKLEKQSFLDPDRYDPNKYVGAGIRRQLRQGREQLGVGVALVRLHQQAGLNRLRRGQLLQGSRMAIPSTPLAAAASQQS